VVVVVLPVRGHRVRPVLRVLRVLPVHPVLSRNLRQCRPSVQHRTREQERRVAKQPKTTFQVRVVEKVEKAKVPVVEVVRAKAQEKAPARVRAKARAKEAEKVQVKVQERVQERVQEKGPVKVVKAAKEAIAKNVQKPPKQRTLP
jgi:hypothetical protein